MIKKLLIFILFNIYNKLIIYLLNEIQEFLEIILNDPKFKNKNYLQSWMEWFHTNKKIGIYLIYLILLVFTSILVVILNFLD